MLFNINELKWDQKLCDFFDIPINCLPEVCSSAEVYGEIQQSKLGKFRKHFLLNYKIMFTNFVQIS